MSFVMRAFAFLAIFTAGFNLMIPDLCLMDEHVAHASSSVQSKKIASDHSSHHDCCHEESSQKSNSGQDSPTKHCPSALCGHACQRTIASSPSTGLANPDPAFTDSNFFSKVNQPLSVELDSLYRPPIAA